ncbi:MAG: M56 family metallopeptidase, partial [Clostridia bacterium]|nr:M56 family metallopeptidase [Clostridia bacterium]
SGALHYRNNIYIANNIPSPFVLGIIRPKIYLPDFLNESEQEYIILHEQTHIKRLDHIIKIIGFASLTVHWFNPLVWLAYKMLCEDMEMACDEAVLKSHGGDIYADYSQSLLNFAIRHKLLALAPLAFGEGDTKKRIKNIILLKKQPKNVTIFTIIIVILIALVCILHPKENIDSAMVEGVYHRDAKLSENAANALVFTINNNDKGRFYSGSYEGVVSDDDDVVIIKMTDGSYYQLHYWYNSGYSFNPLHAGEDDYCSILTLFDADGYAQKKWKMEYYFDGNYLRWRNTYGLDVPFPFGNSFVPQHKVYENWDAVDMNKRFYFDSDMSFSYDRFGEPSVEVGKFEFIELTKDNFDNYFSDSVWYDKISPSKLRRDNLIAFRVVNGDETYYLLSQNDGMLYLLYGYYDAEGETDAYSDDSNIKWCCALSERRGVTKVSLEQVNEQSSLGVVEITDTADIDSFLSALLNMETALYMPREVDEIEKMHNYLVIKTWYGEECETRYLYTVGDDYVIDHTPYATYEIERSASVHIYKIYSKYLESR